MKWKSNLPDDWSDASDDPPAIDRSSVEIVAVDEGYLARPTAEPTVGTIDSNTIYSGESVVPEDATDDAEHPSG